MELQRGAIRTGPGAGLRVQVGELQVEGQGGGVEVRRDPKNDTVQVYGQEGAILRTAQGVVKLKASERAVVTQDGGPQIEKIIARLVSPEDAQRVVVDAKGTELNLNWKWLGENRSAILRVGRSSDLHHPHIETEVEGHQYTLRLPYVSGEEDWFWALGTRRTKGAVRKLVLSGVPVPELVFPDDGGQVELGSKLDFSWRSKSSTFQIRFKNSERTIEEASVSDTSFHIPKGLEVGEYSWAVRARQGSSWSDWSSTRSFEVLPVLEDKESLKAPSVKGLQKFRPRSPHQKRHPKKTSFFHKWFRVFSLLSNVAHAETPQEWIFTLEWKPVDGATSYRVQVARTRAFRELLGEREVKGTQWDWVFRPGVENTKGRVFFRVGAVDSEGDLGHFSSPVPIAIPDEIMGLKSVAKVKEKETIAPSPPQLPVNWSFWGTFSTGFEGVTQSSEASNLSSVELDSLVLIQRLRIGIKRQQGIHSWRGDVEASLGTFQKSASQNTEQTSFSPLENQFRVLRARNDSPYSYGLRITQGYRFEREGVLSVSARSGWGFGLSLERNWLASGEDWVPKVVTAVFDTTFLGYLQVRPSVLVRWGERKFYGLSFSPQVRFFYDLSLWSEPASSRLSRYGLELLARFPLTTVQ